MKVKLDSQFQKDLQMFKWYNESWWLPHDEDSQICKSDVLLMNVNRNWKKSVGLWIDMVIYLLFKRKNCKVKMLPILLQVSCE